MRRLGLLRLFDEGERRRSEEIGGQTQRRHVLLPRPVARPTDRGRQGHGHVGDPRQRRTPRLRDLPRPDRQARQGRRARLRQGIPALPRRGGRGPQGPEDRRPVGLGRPRPPRGRRIRAPRAQGRRGPRPQACPQERIRGPRPAFLARPRPHGQGGRPGDREAREGGPVLGRDVQGQRQEAQGKARRPERLLRQRREDLPAPGDRHDPHGLRLHGRALQADADRAVGHRPRGRALPRGARPGQEVHPGERNHDGLHRGAPAHQDRRGARQGDGDQD